MSCFKTGARLLLEEYQEVYACDLYHVGDCVVARVNPEPMKVKDCPPTYTVEVGNGFWRPDLGILVVPAHRISPC